MNKIKCNRLKKTIIYCDLYKKNDVFFKIINKISSKTYQAPISYLSFITEDGVLYKAQTGRLLSEKTDIKNNPDLITLLNDEIFIIPDTHLYENKALAFNGKNIRFYAAAPLISPEGLKIGTLTILDHQPRNLTSNQLEILKILSTLVITELETRLRAAENAKSQSAAFHKAVHEIKNKNTSISLSTEIILSKIKDQKIVERFARKIKKLNTQVLEQLNKL